MAALRGRLKHRPRERVLVGDEVTLAIHADGAATIEVLHPRRSVLRRRTPGKARGIRAIAANVDQVVVVGAVREPAWDDHLMDRFTAVAEVNGLPVVVVVNKADLAEGASDVAARYGSAGYPVLITSVPTRRGLERLRGHLAACVSLFTGPTGVGKSSLLNELQPGLSLRTAAVSVRSRTGQHTTVGAEMHPFGDRGFVVDTPGLRDIGVWGMEPLEVQGAFPEFAPWLGACRFDNCRHVEEPDCAVAGAAERGKIAMSRLTSYRRLLEEAARAARPWVSGRRR